jgi:hypothetical protein
MYDNGKVQNHEGSWLAGRNDAKAGLIMPGKVEVGMRYYQKIAPGIAEDRAEIVSVTDVLEALAGVFRQVLKTEEINPLKPDEKEYKLYAPGIRLIQDEAIKLVKYTRP